MRIGDLSARTGVSVRALRYYEEQGLLTSTRSGGGQRHYSDEAVHRVACLRELYAAGLTSEAIAALMPCSDAPSDENTEAAHDRLLTERAKVDRRMAELHSSRVAIDRIIALNRSAGHAPPA